MTEPRVSLSSLAPELKLAIAKAVANNDMEFWCMERKFPRPWMAVGKLRREILAQEQEAPVVENELATAEAEFTDSEGEASDAGESESGTKTRGIRSGRRATRTKAMTARSTPSSK